MQTALRIDDTRDMPAHDAQTGRYARTIKASKRVRWDIDHDVIRGRDFDLRDTFLPNGLSLADGSSSFRRRAPAHEPGAGTHLRVHLRPRRAFHRRQGPGALGPHWLGDQVALEALVRFSDEEIKHQELFRRIEHMLEAPMPVGYEKVANRTTSPAPCLARARGPCSRSRRYRAVRAGPLRAEHRSRGRHLAALEGRVQVPLDGGSPARGGRRARVGARGRAARPRRARAGCRRPDRARRRSRRDPAGAGGGRRDVLRCDRRAPVLGGRAAPVRMECCERTAGNTSSPACSTRTSGASSRA